MKKVTGKVLIAGLLMGQLASAATGAKDTVRDQSKGKAATTSTSATSGEVSKVKAGLAQAKAKGLIKDSSMEADMESVFSDNAEMPLKAIMNKEPKDTTLGKAASAVIKGEYTGIKAELASSTLEVMTLVKQRGTSTVRGDKYLLILNDVLNDKSATESEVNSYIQMNKKLMQSKDESNFDSNLEKALNARQKKNVDDC